MKIGIAVWVAGLAVTAAGAGEKDDREQALKAFFEGRTVSVWVDMPATSKGVDVRVDEPDAERIAFGKVNERLGESGVAIREGTRVPITEIRLKDDLIELQLAGGGFNSFWNSSGTVSPTYSGKSRRERDLERDIKSETDSRRKRELERDLRDERRYREQEERRSREIADEQNEIRRERDHRRALNMGSRFNLRFEKKVPLPASTPEGIMEILSPWVDFSGLPGAEAYSKPRRPMRHEDEEADTEDDGALRPGMSRADVQERFGKPESEKTTRNGDLLTSIAVFRDHERRLEVTFVNGVLVQFRELD